jgi:hypothetical protein
MKEKETSDNPAKRLLAKLKSPLLCLASELNSPLTPHIHISPVSRSDKSADKRLCGGRLAGFSPEGKVPWPNGRFSQARQRLGIFPHRKHAAEGKYPSRWYQQRKEAAKEIREVSNGQLELSPYQLYYHGHDRSHQVVCRTCKVTFRLALTEFRLEGPDICPVCFGGLLARLESPERINEVVYRISDGQVLFIRNQFLGCSDTDHRFYHLGCKQPFLASFDHVVRKNREGKGSGCTHCE